VYYREVGRPRIFKNAKDVCFRMEHEEYELLKRVAYSKGMTISEYLRDIISEHLRKEGNLKEEKKEGRKIDERLIKINRARLETQILKIREEFQKDFKFIANIIAKAEKENTLNFSVRIPVNRLRTDIREAKTVLSKKQDEYLTLIGKIVRIRDEAEKLGLDEVSEKAKELGATISDYLTRINTILEKTP